MTDKIINRGWITSEGEFFPCAFHKHNETAKYIMENGLTKGHVITMICLIPDTLYGMLAVTDGDKATRRQRETLFDLCTENGYIFDEVVCLIEDLFE